MVASSRPTMLARSGRGMRSNSGKVAMICPSGEGSWGMLPSSLSSWLRKGRGKGSLGNLVSENTGAVASNPSGE